MADDQFHIISDIKQDAKNPPPFNRKKLRLFAIYSSSLVLVLLTVSVLAIYSITTINKKTASLDTSTAEIDAARSSETAPDDFVAAQKADREILRLRQKIAAFENAKNPVDSELLKEKEAIVQNTIDELAERNAMLDELFQSMGILTPRHKKVFNDKDTDSGGPFIELPGGDVNAEDLLDRVDANLKRINFIPVGRPVTGVVTSRFGARRDPINGRRSFHGGMDFRGCRGEPIHATADGVVLRAFRNGGYGKYIELDHGNGFRTAYGHMSRIKVHSGQQVKKGDVIGLVGNTGRSTGPHLHYEVKRSGKPVNPKRFLSVSTLIQSKR
ncbi:M23 family metallopeptidase [Desulforhopalus vacuolatus]|uniref:M23 family metallopeptidase n=1 Tax=Desulforhopalus vacuolatus TaxID=40414 RepID=UPI0019662F82|nr:M23 family metallopeptidase [Desulforhopalus vacuolatus]MBM9518354.1 M23 family metallopeptidase [Desulforhopalus vacuolatus]